MSKVLIACEESQTVCKAFRDQGIEAYSCDIIPCSGLYPEWHIQEDALKIIKLQWDLIIAHPPCTYLTNTGNRWYNVDAYGDKAKQRIFNRKEAADFFMEIARSDCPRIAIENPVGYMSTYWRKPDQIIQPWMFGDAYEKKTCLWLKGLPKLVASNIVKPPDRIKFASGKTMPRWYAELWALPKEKRSKERSKTFPGIADAMANQWGRLI